MKLSSLFKKKEVEQVEYMDKNLYILTELPKPGLVSYLEANGIHVKKITTSIDEMILSMIREREPIRLVVVDFGSGKFKTLEAIGNIVGLLDQCSSDDGVKAATLFTKEGLIKKEIRDKKLDVDVREFKGSSDIVRALSEYRENYITPGAKDFDGAPSKDLKAFKYDWKAPKKVNGDERLKKFSNPSYMSVENLDMSGDALESFNCKF